MSHQIFDQGGLTVTACSNGQGQGQRLEFLAQDFRPIPWTRRVQGLASLTPDQALELARELQSWYAGWSAARRVE